MFAAKSYNRPLTELAALIGIILLLLCTSTVAAAAPELRVAPGQYLVGYKSVYAAQAATSKDSGLAVNVDNIADGAVHLVQSRMAAARSASINSEGFALYDKNEHEEFCAALKKESPEIEYCEPNFQYKISVTPDDTYQSILWGMENISAEKAWDISTGSPDVTVAIIDTGIDYTHPDLKENMWVNAGEIANNKIDDDKNGYVDDYYGVNVSSGGSGYDDNMHGTHCAGTIGAIGDNREGVAGVNWKVSLMPVKFLDYSGSGTLSDAVKAIYYAIANKADVISASWGGGGYTQSLYDAIKKAGDAGILFVAAAGNDSYDNDEWPSYPASYKLDNVISVASIESSQNLSWFSNYGHSTVHIAAPGSDIASTVPVKQGSYAMLSGTSMATPHVSGVAALIKSVNPDWTFKEIKERLLSSADINSQIYCRVEGGRNLNAYNAVAGIEGALIGSASDGSCATIDRLVNSAGQSKLSLGQAFEMSISGLPASSVSLSMKFKFGSAVLGKCSLGAVVLDGNGESAISGILKSATGLKNANKVLVTAGGDTATRTLTSSKRTSRASSSTSARAISSKAMKKVCDAIAGSMVQN